LLTGYYAALRYAENRAWRWAVLFWVSCILGILSHLLFLYFFLAICLWTVCRLLKKRGPLKDLLVSLVSFNLVPLLFLGVFYWFHMRHLVLLGGPVIPLLLVSFENSGQRRGGSRLRELYNNAGRYFGGRRLCGGHAHSHPGR
jgi:MFS family permease